MDNLLDSSGENNVSAGAFEGCFTMKFERNVAFPMVRIAFMLGDARETLWLHVKGKGAAP